MLPFPTSSAFFTDSGSLRTLLLGNVLFVGALVGGEIVVGGKVVVGSKVGDGVTVGLNVESKPHDSPNSVLNGVIQSSNSLITVQ